MSTIGPAALKRACNMAHARARAAERYALDLTNADLESIAARIQAGADDVAFLRRDSTVKARLWVAVRRDGGWLPIVYDEATRSVLTALPEYAIDAYRSYLAALDGTSPPASVDGLPVPYRSPEVPPRTCNEAEARARALKLEIAAINWRLNNEAGRTPDWAVTRARLMSNRDAIVAERARTLRMIEHTNNGFHNATEVDPARVDDPGHLLAVALTTVRALAKQLGYPPGPYDDTVNAIREYLRRHAPLVDPAEERP
jgi:hypothetical protein